MVRIRGVTSPLPITGRGGFWVIYPKPLLLPNDDIPPPGQASLDGIRLNADFCP